MANLNLSSVPTWLMLLAFVLIELALFTLGDTFTFVVGTLIMILVFSNGYNRTHADDHH